MFAVHDARHDASSEDRSGVSADTAAACLDDVTGVSSRERGS
ncbi:MAG: hypothetical protein V4530_08790 [Pseudomonadota bacterium]